MNIEDTEKLASGEAVTLDVNGLPIKVLPEEVEFESKPIEGYSIVEEGDILIGVNTAIDEALSSEGLARDIVRRIQALRKDSNFDINDHIETYYRGDPEITEVFQEEAEYIKAETLSDILQEGEAPEGAKLGEYEIGGIQLILALRRK